MSPQEYEQMAAPLDRDAGAELDKRFATSESDSEGSDSQARLWPQPGEIKTDLPLAPAFDAKTLLPDTLADFVLDEVRHQTQTQGRLDRHPQPVWRHCG